MREALVQLLVEEGRDPTLTASLAKAAQAYVASGGKNPGGVAPELLQEAMRAGVYADKAFADQLLDAQLLVQEGAMKYLVAAGGRARWAGGK